jgi:mannitol/fructose-specific phosphotransferase system IIA component
MLKEIKQLMMMSMNLSFTGNIQQEYKDEVQKCKQALATYLGTYVASHSGEHQGAMQAKAPSR